MTGTYDLRIIPRLADRFSEIRGVAQPGSATALGAVGRGFESLLPDQISSKVKLSYYQMAQSAIRFRYLFV